MSNPAFKLDSLEHGKRALGLAIWTARTGRFSRPHLAGLAVISHGRMLEIELGAEGIPTDAELCAIAAVLEMSPRAWIEKAKALRAETETQLAGKETV